MDSKTTIRLLDHPAAHGAWNMAVDQAILDSVNNTGAPVLRIYRWSPPTLSLGYFQNFDDRSGHAESTGCDLVRRASGGGAILHDQEITYSLTLPSNNRWATRNTEIYRLVHNAITDVLMQYGVKTHPFDSASHAAPQQPNSFLCFERRSDGDLICNGHKVVGSAQRRSKQAVLQHGSILLETSKFAPQLPGIFEITKNRFPVDDFTQHLIMELCDKLSFVSNSSNLTDCELKIVEAYRKHRFENDDWNIRRKKQVLSN